MSSYSLKNMHFCFLNYWHIVFTFIMLIGCCEASPGDLGFSLDKIVLTLACIEHVSVVTSPVIYMVTCSHLPFIALCSLGQYV